MHATSELFQTLPRFLAAYLIIESESVLRLLKRSPCNQSEVHCTWSGLSLDFVIILGGRFVDSSSRHGAAVIDQTDHKHMLALCRVSCLSDNTHTDSGRQPSHLPQPCAVRWRSRRRPGTVQGTEPSSPTYKHHEHWRRSYRGHSPRKPYNHSRQVVRYGTKKAARHASPPLPPSCAPQSQASRVAMSFTSQCACSPRRGY